MSTTATPYPSYSPPERPLESVPVGEAEAINIVTQVCMDLLDTQTRPVLRQQHPYQHACVRARFEVLGDIPDALRHGVFSSPATYDAIIRFSTSSRRDQRINDSHGFAVKLLGVSGERASSSGPSDSTQDFILLDSPQFFVRNAIDYASFAQALVVAVRRTKRAPLKFVPETGRGISVALTLFRRHFRHRPAEWKILKGMRKPAAHPFRKQYWSATPYRLGPMAVKYQVRPASAHPWLGMLNGHVPKSTDPDWLSNQMRQWLDRGAAAFDFFVQPQVDATAMPVEDATVLWNELVSPPMRVARLTIDPQQFDTPARRAAVETLSFSPAHALAAHAPLGGINRTRLQVYTAVADRRREINGASNAEPDAAWIDRVWEADAAQR